MKILLLELLINMTNISSMFHTTQCWHHSREIIENSSDIVMEIMKINKKFGLRKHTKILLVKIASLLLGYIPHFYLRI